MIQLKIKSAESQTVNKCVDCHRSHSKRCKLAAGATATRLASRESVLLCHVENLTNRDVILQRFANYFDVLYAKFGYRKQNGNWYSNYVLNFPKV